MKPRRRWLGRRTRWQENVDQQFAEAQAQRDDIEEKIDLLLKLVSRGE